MAGTVKANIVQLGDDPIASRNLVIRTNVDGTFTIARGNAGATTQDILTIDASGIVTFPVVPQTWQNLTTSRATSTTYTNTTSRPIVVRAAIIAGQTGSIAGVPFVAGVQLPYHLAYAASPNYITVAEFIVPAGATYRVDTGGSGAPALTSWFELR